jgi:hypothetical protein
MKKYYDIEELTKALVAGEEAIFALNARNKYSLCKFAYYQLKYKTTKEFREISYEKEKDLCYYFLLLCSKLSFGKYKLTWSPSQLF